MFSTYAVIWFDQDQVAIIELERFLGVGDPLTGDDFKNGEGLARELLA